MTSQTQQTINTVLANQANTIANKLMEKVSDAFTELVTEYEYPRLPESLFVNHFLPMFCGKVSPTTKEGLELLRKWLIIARDNLNEVTIFKDDTGEPLFNVPAINSPDIINVAYNKDRKLPSIDDLVGLAESLSNTIPARGANFYAKAMDVRTDVITVNKTVPKLTELSNRWTDIFNRYGVGESDAIKTPSVNPVGKPTSNISEDELEDA